MADNIDDKLFEHSKLMWRSVFRATKNSLVYMDNSIAEILHWSGRTLDLIDAGAKRIQSLDCGVNGGKEDKKAVFITSSLLPGKTVEKLQKIIEPSYFQYCSIFCTVSDTNNALVLKQGGQTMENESFYAKLKETVKFWMNNMYATVDVLHMPFVYARVIPGLFVMPSFASVFPILPSDMTKIQDCLRTKGDHRVFSSLSEVEIHHMPQVFQVKFKLLASALSDFFDALDLTEDCYGIGHTAKLLASEVANLCSTKVKKKTGGRCTVIFVDRTLDLVQPSSHSAGTLADKILRLLPKISGHTLDVMVDMSSLCSSGSVKPSVIVPGSLAHNPSNKQGQTILSSMIKKKPQDCLLDIYNQLIRVLKEESIPFTEDDPTGKVTADKLFSLTKYFRNNLDALIKHSALLQLAMAAVNSLEHQNNSHLQQLQGTEKVLQLSLYEDDSPSCLSHILILLKNVREGTRSYYFEDIILLVLYVYSLVGEEGLDSPAEEDQLKEVIICDVLSRTLQVKTEYILDIERDGEELIKFKITKCFERLSGLKNLRENLTFFKNVFTLSSSTHDLRSYEPILKQIIMKIFEPKKPEINDIEFKSTSLKDYIKSGFSLFMNVSKPHPSDHPVLFLFVLGGITCTEVEQINQVLVSQNIKTKVVIGSTKIMNSQDLLESFFYQDNVLPNLDGS